MDQDVLERRTIWWQCEGHSHIWEDAFHVTLLTERQKRRMGDQVKQVIA